MRRTLVFLAAPLLVLFFISSAFAPTDPIPHMINYQGMLTNDEGTPLNGLYDLTFRIYDVPSGGTALWTGNYNDEEVLDGLFNVILEVPASVFNGPDRYMGITVWPDAELTPRTRLTSVGYAYRAEVADTAKTFVSEVQSDMDDRYVNMNGPDSLVGNLNTFIFKLKNYGVSNGDGISIITEGPGGDAIACYAGDNAVEAFNPGSYGLYVSGAGHGGMYVNSSQGNGMHVHSTDSMGVLIDNAGEHGVYIEKTSKRGITVDTTGSGWNAIHINYAGYNALNVDSCGGSGLVVTGAGGYGINARGKWGNLLRSTNSSYWGLIVYSSGGSSTNNGLKIYGKFEATGTKSSVIPTSQGEERLYAIETPEVEFMTSGRASLVNGEAQIVFERLFQEAISPDIPLKIILTPKGGWSGLYVSEESFSGFSVMSGAGEQNIEFDWIAIGRRKGYEERPIVSVLDVAPEEESQEPGAIETQPSPEVERKTQVIDESHIID